ncbi:unnamed protein product [Phaeothamnion confervicola]
MRFLIFILLVFCSLSLCAQPSQEYTNPEGGYAFKPLIGWTVRTKSNESFAYAPEDGNMDSWSEKLDFSIADGDGIELEDAFDFYINTDFPTAYKKFKLIGKGDEQINGLSAKWALFTFSAFGEAAGATGSGDSALTATLQAVFYVIKKDKSLYLVNGVAEKSLYPKFDLYFRTIIRTFRVKND